MAIFEFAKNGIWSKKNIHEIDLSVFTSFLAWTLKIILAYYDIARQQQCMCVFLILKLCSMFIGRKGNLNRFLSLKQCEKVCLATKSTSLVTEVIVITFVIAFLILLVFVGYKYADYYRSQINYRIFQNQRQVSRSSTGKILFLFDYIMVLFVCM